MQLRCTYHKTAAADLIILGKYIDEKLRFQVGAF